MHQDYDGGASRGCELVVTTAQNGPSSSTGDNEHGFRATEQ
jgi:hypothetical protein